MLRLLVIFGLLLIGCIATADASVYKQVQSAAPHLKHEQVLKLSDLISRSCKKHRIPCNVYTAILAQESMFRIGAVNKLSNDFGIAQLNHRTIKAYNLDKQRLLKDLEYSIDKGALVLSWFYRTYSKREAFWFCRYNVGTGPLIGSKLVNCINYTAKVSQYKIAAD